MHAMRSLIPFIALIAAGSAQAEMYRCTDKAGQKHFQDQPCNETQRGALFDPSGANITTIDSESARREAQGALLTREQTRESQVQVTTPAAADTRVTISGPDYGTAPYDDRLVGYPVYIDRDRRRDRDDRRPPRRPDETPMTEPGRRGGGFVPAPPTIRDVAPRPPEAPRGSSRGRDDGR